MKEEFSLVDHSGDFFHVNFDMVHIEFVQESLEEVLEVAYCSHLNLLAIEALVCEGDLWGVEHLSLKRAFNIIYAKGKI